MDHGFLEIEVEKLPTSTLNEENHNDFINKQIVLGTLDCLDGADFERNLLPTLGIQDRYTRVKLAGKGEADQGYARKIREVVDREVVRKLLYICRFCSYLGGPGFPDVILLKPFGLRYTATDFTLDQKLFLLLARELELGEVKALKTVPEKASLSPDKVRIGVKDLLQEIAQGKRFSHYGKGLEELEAQEKEKLARLSEEREISQARDELLYLGREREKTPFLLLKGWLEQGLNREALLGSMERVEAIAREEQREREEMARLLKDDRGFQLLGKGMDEESVRKKLLFIQNKFLLGESRAAEVLKSLQ